MTDIQREAFEDSTQIDSDPFGLWNRDNRNHRKKLDIILEHTTASPSDHILEVGCGHGLHAERLAERFEYTGIDISESLVSETNSRIDGGAETMDAMELTYDSESFDAVVGTAILHHLRDPERALKEWVRVTDPGGSVTLMEPNYLFPKDFVTAHIVKEERNKTNMAPWRLRRLLSGLDVSTWRVEPRIYTPPWPARAASLYDNVDSICRQVPGLRSLSQMVLIHIEC